MKLSTVLVVLSTCLLLLAAVGLMPVGSQVNADENPALTDAELLQLEDEINNYKPNWDTSTPELTAAEPEAPAEPPAQESAATPTAKASPGHQRDGVLFDGDGYLIDRRPLAAAAAGGEAKGPLRNVLRRLLGVDRRQNRRAAGRGLFGCRC